MMLLHLAAFIIGFLADLLFGDPLGSFHIVVAIGKLIALLENTLRRLLPKTKGGELVGGTLTVLLVCLLSFGVSLALCTLGYRLHWLAGLLVESFLCWQCLASRSLYRESMAVYRALQKEDLPAARQAVGRIVGRDTEALDSAAVSRACVETVAENCSDGIIAPMLFLAIGGAPLGVLYKAINTMDSMLGYKNDRYLYFGRTAARLDDAANFLPARLAALLMTAAALCIGQDGKNGWRILRRDRLNHTSPNSAHTEAVCAGALHIRLGGPSVYFGKTVCKPYIGDDDRPVEAADIPRANALMLACSVLCFLAALIGKGCAILC